MFNPKLVLIISFVLIWSRSSSFVVGDVDQWPSTESDHSKLNIVVPSSLQKKGGLIHKDALFGYPSYSTGSLQSKVVYTKETGCEPIPVDKWEPPFALMLDRGGCHFVEKVRAAQHAGARAVIIADDKCLCSDLDCMRSTGDSNCELNLPFMADDESGGDITIPSVLIRKSDAIAIKKELEKSTEESNVMVKFEWGIPSPDGRVEWTLWHSSWDEQSMVTLKEMATIALTLGERAFFTPHYVSYNGSKVGCQGTNFGAKNPCGNMCLNAGRYCLLDPSPFHDQAKGAAGADVVIENLRRLCIWNITSAEDPGVGSKWWKYVLEFDEKCSQSEETFVNKKCATRAMKFAGVDPLAVERCMVPYGPEVDEVNPILEKELMDQTSLQLLRLPALYVDGVHARGRIDGANTLDMVCAGYGVHNPPEVCECVNQSPVGMMECVKHGSYSAMTKARGSGGVGFGTILFILVLVAMVAGSVGFVYWRRTQLHMREQVRSILAEYMPLDDLEGDLSPRSHPAVVASAKSPRGFLPTKVDAEDE